MRATRLALFVLLCSLTACRAEQPVPQVVRVCTSVGCAGAGLHVSFLPQPSGPFRVEAHAPGMAAQAVECPAAEQCPGRVHFGDFTPERVELRFRSATDTFTQAVQAQYGTRRPNGPDCPPVCRSGYVRVELPQHWSARE